jgi:hypothetical protein
MGVWSPQARIAAFVVGGLGLNVLLSGGALVACAVRHSADPAAQCNVELQECNKAAAQLGATGLAILGMSSLFAPVPKGPASLPYLQKAPPDSPQPVRAVWDPAGQ